MRWRSIVDNPRPGGFAGLPSCDQAFVGIVDNALPLLGIGLVIQLTVQFLRLGTSFNALFAGSIFANAMLVALGYMRYREARDIAKLGIGLSIAFAALSIVALVALPYGLYMLTVPAASAA